MENGTVKTKVLKREKDLRKMSALDSAVLEGR